jgi:DNA-binding CsgD family transcriptional regulator
MAGNLATLEKKGESGSSTVPEVEFDDETLKVIFRFLNEINEIKDDRSWMPSKADPEHTVIFKTTLFGTCYTLLASEPKHDNKVEHTLLSPREQEIVRLASRGMSNKTIAAVLDISPWTVSTYIRRIFSKLNVNTRVEMVAVLTKSGLFEENVSPQLAKDNPAVQEFQKLISYLVLVNQ